MGPGIRYHTMMQEAAWLARDGELGNSDAIRLLQIPHSVEEVKAVLQRFDRQLTREARGKLTLEAFAPRPRHVDNQRYEPIFERHPITGKTYTTLSGEVVLNEVHYYNGQMVQFYGECTNVAAVNEALAGSGYQAVTLKHANGDVTAVAQLWGHELSDTSLRPYNAMFIVLPVEAADAPLNGGCIAADGNGAACVLPVLNGCFDSEKGIYQNSARLFFLRLLDSTKIAIDFGRERMGTDKRPGTIDLKREGRLIALSIRDGDGNLVARSQLVLTDDSAAYVDELAKAAATAGIPFSPLPSGTEHVYPSVARIERGPVVHWDWCTDVVPRLQRATPDMLAIGSSSEEGALLLSWGFTPKALGFVPNVRGVVDRIPESQQAQRLAGGSCYGRAALARAWDH